VATHIGAKDVAPTGGKRNAEAIESGAIPPERDATEGSRAGGGKLGLWVRHKNETRCLLLAAPRSKRPAR